MEFPYISFSKGKEFNNKSDNLQNNIGLFFDIICTKKISMEKSQDRQKCGFMEKLFLIKLVHCFKLMAVSN